MPFIPPQPEKGDPNTLAGYAAVHGRPAAFEGTDGLSYSVEILTDMVSPGEFGAYLLFMRWSDLAAPMVVGHLESDFLCFATTPDAASAALGAFQLSQVRETLAGLIAESAAGDGNISHESRWGRTRREEHDKS